MKASLGAQSQQQVNNQGFEKDIDPRHRHVRVEDGVNARHMVDGEGQEDEALTCFSYDLLSQYIEAFLCC